LQKLLESETFFLDRCLGKKILVSVLRAATLKIEVHDDHFPPDAKDEDWLQIVGARGWIVLTSDRRIRYRVLELAALKASGVRAFTFRSGNLTDARNGRDLPESFTTDFYSIEQQCWAVCSFHSA
jgi:hypothetical protein